MINIRKGVSFQSEERAIRNQVHQGLRCPACLRPCSGGRSRYSRPAADDAACPQCSRAEAFPAKPQQPL